MKHLALILGKFSNFLLKKFNRNGGSLPGKIAVKLCPDILKYFKYPNLTILITGTNGKTSTANLIKKTLEKEMTVASNENGDNIINGIVSLLIKNSNLNFKIKTDSLVLEIDELTLARNIHLIQASDIVITNFFRDQLDRTGDMENVISKIATSLILSDYKNNLYLNEDDPNVKRFAYRIKNANVQTFGIEKNEFSKTTSKDTKDIKFCPFCNNLIHFSYYHYSHLGKFYCDNCSFRNDIPNYLVTNIDKENSCFSVHINKTQRNFAKYLGEDRILSYKDPLNSKEALLKRKETADIVISCKNVENYNVYNMISAFCVLNYNKIKLKNIIETFSNFDLHNGRIEEINTNKGTIFLNLVKNPTGTNETLKLINNSKNKKSILFLLNNNVADGKDISWIYDVNFENLENIETFILTGKRAYELALRIKLSKIAKKIVVKKDEEQALDYFMNLKGEKYALSTYTGLFPLRNIIINKFAK